MLGEVHYGGRVTDDFDKRLLNTFCSVWFNEGIFAENFSFHKGYKIVTFKQVSDYITMIDTFPPIDPPQAYGLHPNADITYVSTRETSPKQNKKTHRTVSIQVPDQHDDTDVRPDAGHPTQGIGRWRRGVPRERRRQAGQGDAVQAAEELRPLRGEGEVSRDRLRI